MSSLSQTEIAYFSQKRLDVQAFLGRWYIVKTNLNFWQQRLNPTVTYSVERTTPDLCILDEVQYVNQRGVARQVVGADRLVTAGGSLFHWVGKPWYLRFLQSMWGVVDHDERCQQWAVTYFAKTAFTAAGMDIYARTPLLDDDLYHHILARSAKIAFLHKHIATLYPTKQ